MAASASALEVEEALGASVLFSLEPILVNLEVGCYTGPIIPASLADPLQEVGQQARVPQMEEAAVVAAAAAAAAASKLR